MTWSVLKACSKPCQTYEMKLFGKIVDCWKLLRKLFSLHKKWSFPLRISSVYVTEFAVSCRFGHVYWRIPKLKTSFLLQCLTMFWIQCSEYSLYSRDVITTLPNIYDELFCADNLWLLANVGVFSVNKKKLTRTQCQIEKVNLTVKLNNETWFSVEVFNCIIVQKTILLMWSAFRFMFQFISVFAYIWKKKQKCSFHEQSCFLYDQR